MKISKSFLTTAALVASFSASANAQVTGSLGGGTLPFLSLSAPSTCTAVLPCTLGPGVASIVGGEVFFLDKPFADIPAGVVIDNRFLASGTQVGSPLGSVSTMTFSGGYGYVSFLWGSPDTNNKLTVNTTAGSQVFTASGLGFAQTNGNQAFSQYVQFQANAGVTITSLVFENSPAFNAFEVANFSVVPEPSTYALMAVGLAALAVAAKRRKLA